MPSQNRVRIYAGPNGSGKSSLYDVISKEYISGLFVNADLIEKQLKTIGFIDLTEFNLKINPAQLDTFKKLPSSISLINKAISENHEINVVVKDNFILNKPKSTNSYEAAFAASFIRNSLLEAKRDFTYETVMSDRHKLDEITQANKLGYKTYLYFICTDDFEKNVERVKNRVLKNGHNVDEEKIKKRYFKTLENLADAIKLVHRAYIFDNSGDNYELLAEIYQGTAFKFHTALIPLWFEKYVYDKFDF
jgi:predicted ABC-type ATPase